uniref:Hairy and enhancer of split-related protein HELT n=1 Tax=Sinocyclocheilus rhinocerous TaxID=307959 RepID=A0A673FVP8_9TELE
MNAPALYKRLPPVSSSQSELKRLETGEPTSLATIVSQFYRFFFQIFYQMMASKMKDRKKTPVSHKVIEKRRRDRINRCLNELGKTVPMALAKQNSGKLEKAEILEMTVQYLRALHSADFPNHLTYIKMNRCMKNLVHYLTTVERMETKDTKYARILAFLQSKVVTEPVFGSLGTISPDPTDLLCQLEYQSPSPSESVFQQSPPGHFSWHSSARNPTLAYPAMSQHSGYLSPVQGLDHHYMNFIGHSHPHNAFSLHNAQHAAL